MENKAYLTNIQMEDLLKEQGLILVGYTELVEEPRFTAFQDWLLEKRNAGMGFLEKNLHIRQFPAKLSEGALQAVIFALPYYQGDKLNSVKSTKYRIAQYARLRDYHKEMRRRAEIVLSKLKDGDPDLVGRIAIDSAPILERALAERGGSGFIGKNTCYIDSKKGSFFLLGEIFVNRVLFQNAEVKPVASGVRSQDGGCGTCRRCQVHCPTGALDQDFKLDANKCIAYWTIEHRGVIPVAFWPWVGKYIFGCDICQLACPYNRSANLSSEAPSLPSTLSDEEIFLVSVMDQSFYEKFFGGTPTTRAKIDGLRRNALIAMYQSSHTRLNEALEQIDEGSADVLKQTKKMIEEDESRKK